MNDKQLEIMTILGYKEINLGRILCSLISKPTKVAANVVNRIQNQRNGAYQIFTNETMFTVHSQYLVTKEEQRQLQNILNLEYVRLGPLVDREGYWLDWVGSIEY